MKQTVTEYEFIKAFNDYNRSDSFSIPARKALFNYYTDLEEDSGEEMELDVIGICCEWVEYDSELEALDEYGFESLDDFYNKTIVIELDNGHVLIMAF